MSRREKLEGMLAKQPDDIFLQYALAMELMKEGAIDGAVAQFDRVLQTDPTYIAAYQQKAQALARGNRMADAAACLDQGIQAAARAGDHHAAEEMQSFKMSLGA